MSNKAASPRLSKKPAQTGANRRRERSSNNRSAWVRHHKDCASQSLMRLLRSPVASALTWLVIAISLTLPTLFYLALSSLQAQTSQWQEGGQITLYLEQGLANSEGDRLTSELNARPEVARAYFISADEAWASFQDSLSISRQEMRFEGNPLPASIVVIPAQQNSSQLEALQLIINGLPEVEDVQLDLAWIERLNRFLDLIYSVVTGLALLLGVAVLLVVGNTIRLAIESRKDEIRVIKLLGATEAFVRRPFVYLGIWYGLLGGVAAWILVTTVAWWLRGPLAAFLNTYGLEANVAWLGFTDTIVLILASIGVSLAGAHIALQRHLKDAEPR
jgi:cell division transport system permease protein